MTLKKFIERLEKARLKYVEKHGHEPEFYDVTENTDCEWGRYEFEFGKMTPYEGGGKYCKHHTVLKVKLC